MGNEAGAETSRVVHWMVRLLSHERGVSIGAASLEEVKPLKGDADMASRNDLTGDVAEAPASMPVLSVRIESGATMDSPVDSLNRVAAATTESAIAGAASSVMEGALVPQVPGYRVMGRLGEGGMGVVWRAIQEGTHRTVALKLMSAASLGSMRSRLRFQREVDLTARLEHPHIAGCTTAGRPGDSASMPWS